MPPKKKNVIPIDDINKEFDRTASMRFLHCQGYLIKARIEARIIYIRLMNMDKELIKELIITCHEDYAHLDNHAEKMASLIEDALRFYLIYKKETDF